MAVEKTEGFDNNTGVNMPDDMSPGVVPPLPPGAPVEVRDAHWRKYVYLGEHQLQLTIRAVLIGGILGGLMSITGLFITLKTGWGLGLTIIATLGSYAVMNVLTNMTKGGIRHFTMLENNCMTSTATSASASTGMTIVACFGGLLLVAPDTIDPKAVHNPHWLAMGSVVFFTAMLGICIAIPIKRRMINDEDLAFPSPRAGAEMLRSLYADGREGMVKARALFVALAIGGLVGLFRGWETLSEGFAKLHANVAAKNPEAGLAKFAHAMESFCKSVPSIPDNLAIRTPDALGFKGAKLNGLAFEPSLLLTAVGMIVGLRVAVSMFVSSIILYFILAPQLFHADEMARAALAGTEAASHFKAAMEVKNGVISPMSWGLWGGTALLIASSFTSLVLQAKALSRSFTGVFSKSGSAKNDPIADIEVPVKWALIGAVPCAIGLTLSLWLGFGVNPILGVLALVISCMVSIVCARTAAETDINPIGAMGKVTQVIYAVLPGAAGNAAINLVSAGSTSAAGGSSVDMLGDLKSSHLLGANARKVWFAQIAGVFFGIVPVMFGWYLIVPDKETLATKFNAIPAIMWSTVAKFLTDPKAQFYHGAVALMIASAIVGVALTLLSHFAPKIARFLPSALGLGIGLSLPFYNTFAFLIGAMIMLAWEKGWRKTAVFFGLIVASGLMSGEAVVSSLILLGSQAMGLVGH